MTKRVFACMLALWLLAVPALAEDAGQRITVTPKDEYQETFQLARREEDGKEVVLVPLMALSLLLDMDVSVFTAQGTTQIAVHTPAGDYPGLLRPPVQFEFTIYKDRTYFMPLYAVGPLVSTVLTFAQKDGDLSGGVHPDPLIPITRMRDMAEAFDLGLFYVENEAQEVPLSSALAYLEESGIWYGAE